MAESIITLGIGGSPNGLTPFLTSGLNGRDVGDAKNIITLGIGADPGGLVWFLTGGLKSISVKRSSRLYRTQSTGTYETSPRRIDEL